MESRITVSISVLVVIGLIVLFTINYFIVKHALTEVLTELALEPYIEYGN